MIIRRTIFIISLALFMPFANGSTQDQAQMRGPAAERIEQFKKVRLMEVLKMDDETSIRFSSLITTSFIACSISELFAFEEVNF